MQHRAETALNSAPHEKYWFCTRQRKGGSGHEGQDTYEKKPNTKKKKKPIEEERRISIGTECKRVTLVKRPAMPRPSEASALKSGSWSSSLTGTLL